MSAPKTISSARLKDALGRTWDAAHLDGKLELSEELTKAVNNWARKASKEDTLNPWEVQKVVKDILSALVYEK